MMVWLKAERRRNIYRLQRCISDIERAVGLASRVANLYGISGRMDVNVIITFDSEQMRRSCTALRFRDVILFGFFF